MLSKQVYVSLDISHEKNLETGSVYGNSSPMGW